MVILLLKACYFKIIMIVCMQDLTEGNTDNLDSVRNGLAEELAHLCPRCGLTAANIKDNEFSCRHGGLTTQIVYRARIVGTDVYSAPGLVSLMQSWVGSGMASIMVQSSRLHLDPTCDASLDTLKAPDCEGSRELSITTTTTTTTEIIIPSVSSESVHNKNVSLGEIGGITVGILIAALLVIIIALIIAVIIWKLKSRLSIRFVYTHTCWIAILSQKQYTKATKLGLAIYILLFFFFYSIMIRKLNDHSRMPKDSDIPFADVRRYSMIHQHYIILHVISLCSNRDSAVFAVDNLDSKDDLKKISIGL